MSAGASVAACGSCRIRFGEDVLVGERSRNGLLVAVEPPEPVFAHPVVGGDVFRRIGAQGEYVPADGVASVVGELAGAFAVAVHLGVASVGAERQRDGDARYIGGRKDAGIGALVVEGVFGVVHVGYSGLRGGRRGLSGCVALAAGREQQQGGGNGNKRFHVHRFLQRYVFFSCLPLPLCGLCRPAQDRFAADLDAELRRLAQDAPCEGGFVGFGSVAEIALGGADMGGVDERKFAA